MAVRDESRAYAFTMEFISVSDKYKRQYIDKWQEVLANFMVDPTHGSAGSQYTTTPYRQGRIYTGNRRNVVLKDPETHKAIMTYASKLVRSLFGSREREYIKARPTGYEDAPQKAPTVSKLLRYELSRPGVFRTWVESVIDMLLFGTAVVEISWEYCEREMPVRVVTSELGVELDSFQRMKIPIYDDVKITPVDVVDFYPDPSRYRIDDMPGAAKRFKMNAIEARMKAAQQIYDEAGVNKAISALGKQSSTTKTESHEDFRVGFDRPSDTDAHADFREMICYEYWGDVPWEDDYGSSRRVITVMNNVVVRNDPWPISDPHLPWYSLIINPVQGRFWGISPAEVIRYDQDFADTMKILLAEAVLRQVHPPIAYDSDADFGAGGEAKIRDWKADQLIAVRGGPGAIGTLRYDANVQNGFNMLVGLKNSMQEASGALGGIQGEPGPDRESATGAQSRIQMAMDRPELAAMLIENDCLPQVGLAILRRCQQFLDTEGLKARVGEQPEPIWIGDIMGEFDLEFVGSRMAMTRQEKLQSYDRMGAMAAAVPPLMAQIPWNDIAVEMVGDLMQLPEVAAKMQDPKTVLMNLLLSNAMGQGGAAQNGVPSAAEPAGMLPAQAGGGPV